MPLKRQTDLRQEFEAKVEELISTIGVLNDDLQKMLDLSRLRAKQLENAPASIFLKEQATWWRTESRLVFSIVDSACYNMKQIALLLCEKRGKSLSDKDLEKLREVKADGSPRFLPTGDNFKFAFEKFFYAFDQPSPIKFGKEWAVFLRALKKRDKITHPKKRNDLNISITEHRDIAEVFVWFSRLMSALPRKPASQAPPK